jgi:glucan-binding YG repeat protein
MTIDKKTPSDCGFDNPSITAKVTTAKDGEYSVFIGDESPDQSGTYLMTSKNDKIYLVETYTLDDLSFTLTDFADDSYIEAATFKTDTSDYKDQNGNITTFDYVKVSGKNYPAPLNIIPNTDSFAQYIYYTATSPMKRYADNVGDITTMFSQSTTVAGGYTFDADGKIILPKNGIVLDEDGEIRYYVDGVVQHAGLVQDADGNYYYFGSNGKAKRDCYYGISKTNGLLPPGGYTFGADGKIVF